MKKIFTLILLLCMVLSLSACGKAEITVQEIYDACQVETLFKSHQSVSVQNELDGIVWNEIYLTDEYVFDYVPGVDEESDYAELMKDDVNYVYSGGNYLCYFSITPDGVSDFASVRAERYASVFAADILDKTIESASKKDGRIFVESFLSEKAIAEKAEEGLISIKSEYVLDAKTNELISVATDYVYEDEEVRDVTEVAYDEEAPEMLEVFLKYVNQTENLRNVTIVSNPGTEKELSQNFQLPEGLIVGFTWDDAFEDKVELCFDADCTESYNPYVNIDSDITIYVKWAE